MLLRDENGAMFDSADIEAATPGVDDPDKGPLAGVRLKDGTSRLVPVAELELAAREDLSGSSFFASWPMPPSSG